MAVLKERQGRGVALAVRLRQSFRRPRGGRAGEARHDEMKNDNNDKCALASRQGHDKSPSVRDERRGRSEEHTSELQSLMRISYAVFCLKKKKPTTNTEINT